MNTIATMAKVAIETPTAITPKHIFASRPRFSLPPGLRICAGFAPGENWAIGFALWLTRLLRVTLWRQSRARMIWRRTTRKQI